MAIPTHNARVVELAEAIKPFICDNIHNLSDWYGQDPKPDVKITYDKIKELKEKGILPEDFKIEGDSIAARNIHLRQSISDNWSKLNNEQLEYLARWIVSEWGSIKKWELNNQRNELFTRSKIILENLAFNQISSHSKILSFRNPKEYAIYDSRVAAALNVLQELKFGKGEYKRFFPIPSPKGQGFVAKYKQQIHKKNTKQEEAFFYKDYIELLTEIVKNERDITIEKLEMFLFSIGPSLCKIYLNDRDIQVKVAIDKFICIS